MGRLTGTELWTASKALSYDSGRFLKVVAERF